MGSLISKLRRRGKKETTERRPFCQDTIERMVETFLKNKDINHRFIPDAIERNMYYNMIRIILAVVDETLETTRIEFLGHEIRLRLEPICAKNPPS